MTLARPLVRPAFAKASMVVFLLLVPVVAHAVWDYVEARRLRSRIEAIAARGEPLTARDGVEPLTGGAEASERYYRAAAALRDDDGEWPPGTSNRIRAAERDGVWPPELLAVVGAAVERNLDALALADRAAPLPFVRFLSETSTRGQMGQLFGLARLADWRAVVRAAAGDVDGAMDSLYSEARLARTLQWPPRFAALPFVLKAGRPSAAASARLADALTALDRDDYLARHFLQLRARLLDDHRRARPAWPTPAGTWSIHQSVTAIDQYGALARAAARPWPEPLRAVPDASWPNGHGPMNRRDLLEGTATFWARLTQSVRCARLRLSDGSLELVDPFTGRFLQLGTCKL